MTTSRAILQQEQSPLFRLPAELRHHILELVLKVHPKRDFGVILKPDLQSDKIAAKEKRGMPRSVLSVLLTCRRLLDEVEGLFYTTNLICVRKEDYIPFVSSLGQVRRNAITRLTIRELRVETRLLKVLSQLVLLPNLKCLRLVDDSIFIIHCFTMWTGQVTQLQKVLRQHTRLERVKLIMPTLQWLYDPVEIQRREELVEVERKLQAAVQGRGV